MSSSLLLQQCPEFHMTDSLPTAVPAFVSRVSMSASVDKTLLRR